LKLKNRDITDIWFRLNLGSINFDCAGNRTRDVLFCRDVTLTDTSGIDKITDCREELYKLLDSAIDEIHRVQK